MVFAVHEALLLQVKHRWTKRIGSVFALSRAAGGRAVSRRWVFWMGVKLHGEGQLSG